jgi:hypothetical protein
VPDAKVHLQLATEYLEESRGLMGNNNRRAATLAALAQAEARLAQSLTKASVAQEEVATIRTNLLVAGNASRGAAAGVTNAMPASGVTNTMPASGATATPSPAPTRSKPGSTPAPSGVNK